MQVLNSNNNPLIVAAVIFTLGLIAAVMSWFARQLWGSKPSFHDMDEAFQVRFDRFRAEDIANDTLMLEGIRSELRTLNKFRDEDHLLLLEIYRTIGNIGRGPEGHAGPAGGQGQTGERGATGMRGPQGEKE